MKVVKTFQSFKAITKLKTSPFIDRTSKLNQTQEWRRWSGFLSAAKYDLNHENEYFAIRTKAALIDISPLYKYNICGPEAITFLDRLVTRNIHKCKIGQAMYTPWCDENGKVIDDGTVQRLNNFFFRLTSAEPNLTWLLENSNGMDVEITDVSNSIAALAIQGPNSRLILNNLSSSSLNNLKFFNLAEITLNNIPVTISRTGYTGDLGYEIWVDSSKAIKLWDLIIEAGISYGITPAGLYALDMARIEAGLILMDVDYISSRHALVENQKSSPFELNLDWTVKIKGNDFIGKRALQMELLNPPKWKLKGIEIEWESLEKEYKNIGLPTYLPSGAWRDSIPLYYKNEQVGYATSGCWSPLLKRYIALAHIKNQYTDVGCKLKFEIKVEHIRKLISAIVVNTPFFNPKRKRSCPS